MIYIYPVSTPGSRCGSEYEDDSYHYSGKVSVSYAVFRVILSKYSCPFSFGSFKLSRPKLEKRNEIDDLLSKF